MRWVIMVVLLVGGCSYSGPCDAVALSLDDAGWCDKYRDEVAEALVTVPKRCGCEIDGCKVPLQDQRWARVTGSVGSGSLTFELHLPSNSLLCSSSVSFTLSPSR